MRNLDVLIPGTRPSEPVDSIDEWIASGLYPRRRSCVEPQRYKVAWCRFCDTPVPWHGRKPYCDVDQDGERSCEKRYKSAKRHMRYEETVARADVDKSALRELHHLRSGLLDSLQSFIDACADEQRKRLPAGHFLYQHRREVAGLTGDVKQVCAAIRGLPKP